MLSSILMLFLHHLNSHPSDSATCSFTISTLLTWVTICNEQHLCPPRHFHSWFGTRLKKFAMIQPWWFRNPKAKAPTTGLDVSIQTLWIMGDFNYRSLKDGEFFTRICWGPGSRSLLCLCSFRFHEDFKAPRRDDLGGTPKNRETPPKWMVKNGKPY